MLHLQQNIHHEVVLFNVVFVEPKFPPNTVATIRLCANAGVQLHLIEPLGFPLETANSNNAGTTNTPGKLKELAGVSRPRTAKTNSRMFAMTTHGSSIFAQTQFEPGDYFVFGAETRSCARTKRVIPKRTAHVCRCVQIISLNLSNSVAIVVYEACQHDFEGGA